MTQPTTERLALAMEEAGCPAEAIALARQGYYDDFKSPLELPIIELVTDLRRNGFPELAERAIAGEFDSTAEESEQWFRTEGRSLIIDTIVDHVHGKRPKPKGFG